MNIDELEKKLNKISCESDNLDEKYKDFFCNEQPTEDNNYSDYDKNNKIYKDWIGKYSKSYIEMSEYYVGEELPREHYLQSKKDVIELYKLFIYYGMMEQYINMIFK
tara:strand:- start:20 stop:340 length:321 start_codon:yes stop_codon:yes gene_type:complete